MVTRAVYAEAGMMRFRLCWAIAPAVAALMALVAGAGCKLG